MALGLTQPLTEMSTTNISWGKGGWCVGLITLLPSCADFIEIWELHPPGTLRACNGIALPFNQEDNARTVSAFISKANCYDSFWRPPCASRQAVT